MTLTGTWLLPIAIIPGTWEVYEVPRAPRAMQQMHSQSGPTEADDTIPAETQKAGPREERILDKSVSRPRVDPLQEHDQNRSEDELSQSRPDPGPSALQIHPEHGHLDPMYSNSCAFHYTQSQYPPGMFFIPTSGYPIPADGYHQPMNPEYTSKMYEPPAHEPTAPPPVVLHTVPLPDTEPHSQRQRSPRFEGKGML